MKILLSRLIEDSTGSKDWYSSIVTPTVLKIQSRAKVTANPAAPIMANKVVVFNFIFIFFTTIVKKMVLPKLAN